jgi:uncharacterized membrane protein
MKADAQAATMLGGGATGRGGDNAFTQALTAISCVRGGGTGIAILLARTRHPRRGPQNRNSNLKEKLMMNPSQKIVRQALASLIALSAIGFAASTIAADAHKGEEQCAGVVKAGKNDCATATNACHGHVESDASPMAWIYLPKGTCAKIAGARVVKVKDPTPIASNGRNADGRKS